MRNRPLRICRWWRGLTIDQLYDVLYSGEQAFTDPCLRCKPPAPPSISIWRRHHSFPPMAQLAVALKMKSTGGVFKTLNRLVDAGLLERVGRRYSPTEAFFALPLLGPVRAGVPQQADATQSPKVLSLENFLIDNPVCAKHMATLDDLLARNAQRLNKPVSLRGEA